MVFFSFSWRTYWTTLTNNLEMLCPPRTVYLNINGPLWFKLFPRCTVCWLTRFDVFAAAGPLNSKVSLLVDQRVRLITRFIATTMSETNGEKDEILLELAVDYVISGGQYATDLSKDKTEQCGKRRVRYSSKKEKFSLKARKSCEGTLRMMHVHAMTRPAML